MSGYSVFGKDKDKDKDNDKDIDKDKDKDNLTWMLYMQAPVSRSQTHSRPSTDADPAVEGESRSGGIYRSHVNEEYCQCDHL